MVRTIALVLLFLAACDTRNVPQSDSGSGPGSDAVAPGRDFAEILPDWGQKDRCDNNSQCHSSQYCKLDGCEAGTKGGVCTARPQSCDTMYAPVCGCDGKTHGNACGAASEGVNVAYIGECPTTTGITVVTDKTSYAWGQTVKATLTNGTAASVFLAGCAAYAIERKEGGVFVDKGTTVDCAWEGIAKEVKPGASLTETVYPFKGGSYRIRADYGLGCTLGKPLSSAGCSSFAKAHSAAFLVAADPKQCGSLQQSYAAALAAGKTCDPSINMPQCLHKVPGAIDSCGCPTYVNTADKLKALQGEWQDLGCLPSPCPPMPCPALLGATCGKNLLCQDQP